MVRSPRSASTSPGRKPEGREPDAEHGSLLQLGLQPSLSPPRRENKGQTWRAAVRCGASPDGRRALCGAPLRSRQGGRERIEQQMVVGRGGLVSSPSSRLDDDEAPEHYPRATGERVVAPVSPAPAEDHEGLTEGEMQVLLATPVDADSEEDARERRSVTYPLSLSCRIHIERLHAWLRHVRSNCPHVLVWAAVVFVAGRDHRRRFTQLTTSPLPQQASHHPSAGPAVPQGAATVRFGTCSACARFHTCSDAPTVVL